MLEGDVCRQCLEGKYFLSTNQENVTSLTCNICEAEAQDTLTCEETEAAVIEERAICSAIAMKNGHFKTGEEILARGKTWRGQ